MLIVAMLFMSVASFSQITISQEDYNRLPGETRTQIEKITTEKAIKGEIKEVSEYASLGKEIGVAVNETLKAVEDSAIRISESNLGQTAITIVVWKLLYKEIAGVVIGILLLGISLFLLITGRGKLSKDDKDAGGWISVVGGAVFFISSMIWLRSSPGYRLVYSSYILCIIASWMYIRLTNWLALWKGGRVRFNATVLKTVGR